jgi:putative ABC transport system permease protein
MAIAVRERIGELAVFKAVGFTDRFVLLLVLGESVVISAVGGVIGLTLSKIFTLSGDPTRGLLPFFYLPTSAILTGLGILAGILPATSAMRLRVVDALRKV